MITFNRFCTRAIYQLTYSCIFYTYQMQLLLEIYDVQESPDWGSKTTINKFVYELDLV